MVTIQGNYLGDLRCDATHMPSGSRIITDAPADNMGKGESFSPTDLVATALGTCVVTTMAIVAARRGIDFAGASFRIEKHMATDPVRRIGRLPLTIRMSSSLDVESRAVLERAAHTCPVSKSLHPEVVQTITFEYA
jgi:putative redox protein